MRKSAAVAVIPANPKLLAIERKVAAHSPILHKAATITILNPAGYQNADALLDQIVGERKAIEADVAEVLDPLNLARTAALNLRRKLDMPWENAERTLRTAMSQYKLEETRQERAAKEAQDAEAQRLQREIEAKESQALKARTAPMRERLTVAKQQLEERQVEVLSQPMPEMTTAAHSTTRMVTKWRLVDIDALMAAVESGHVPKAVRTVDTSIVDQYVRAYPDAVAQWAGIEVYQDMQIVRRG